MRILLIFGISVMFMLIISTHLSTTTVKALPPCDDDIKKPCNTISSEPIKEGGCSDCPDPMRSLDLNSLKDDDDIRGGGTVNVSESDGVDTDLLTTVVPNQLSMQNSSLMGFQNSSMMKQ